MDIFVGNLPFESNESDLKKLFDGFGNVASAVIIMCKGTKLPKSRGFGFVQMPDEQQALAAIAALNNREFMGRVLVVGPARSKPGVPDENELKQKKPPKAQAQPKQPPQEEGERVKKWFEPVFNKTKTRKEGRRTRSYKKKRGLTGMQEEVKPRRKNKDNPMRWRKKKNQAKPWQKTGTGEQKPWKKAVINGRTR